MWGREVITHRYSESVLSVCKLKNHEQHIMGPQNGISSGVLHLVASGQHTQYDRVIMTSHHNDDCRELCTNEGFPEKH